MKHGVIILSQRGSIRVKNRSTLMHHLWKNLKPWMPAQESHEYLFCLTAKSCYSLTFWSTAPQLTHNSMGKLCKNWSAPSSLWCTMPFCCRIMSIHMLLRLFWLCWKSFVGESLHIHHNIQISLHVISIFLEPRKKTFVTTLLLMSRCRLVLHGACDFFRYYHDSADYPKHFSMKALSILSKLDKFINSSEDYFWNNKQFAYFFPICLVFIWQPLLLIKKSQSHIYKT